ncbi:MAG: hypothetical protein SGBAC_007868 [Bacillariaceae sp.]
MMQQVFDKLESRSRGTTSSPRSNPILKRINEANGLPSSPNMHFLDTLDTKNRAGSGSSTTRHFDQSESELGYLSADDIDKGEDGIIRSSRKKVAKARFAYREDPEYWTGRRGSTILQRGRRRSSMMYPQVKETAATAALACSLMI